LIYFRLIYFRLIYHKQKFLQRQISYVLFIID
jgi:hypothetical protein